MHGLSVRQTFCKFTNTKLTCLLLRATERTLISAERKTMWKRKDGDAQNLQYGDSDIIESSCTSGEMSRARGGVSGGRNSGHQDNNDN